MQGLIIFSGRSRPDRTRSRGVWTERTSWTKTSPSLRRLVPAHLTAFLLASGSSVAAGQAPPEKDELPEADKSFDFEGDVIRPGDDELAQRIAMAENKIDGYLRESRTSAKEGLRHAFQDFAVWFPEYNERKEPPGVEAIRALLVGSAKIVTLALPQTAVVSAFSSTLVADITDDVGEAERRLGNTQKFLNVLERKYEDWILAEGLKVYTAFRGAEGEAPSRLYAAAVDMYVEDFETYSVVSGGARDEGPLRDMMESLGVLGPGESTRRKYHECGLFLLVKHALWEGRERVGPANQYPWEFMGLDLDSFTRDVIDDNDFIDWKPALEVCLEARDL